MGPIFDRREAVMGLCPWRRTVCEGVGERWCVGAGCMLRFPVMPRLARMSVREVDGTDFRPSRSGDETEPVAAHSLRGCRGAMVAVCLPRVSGHTETCTHVLAREVDGTDFRPSRNGDETEPVAAHSLRGCRGAMVRRGRLYAYRGFPVAPIYVGARVDGTRFSTVEKRRWGRATLITKP
jgi:hypothetical protein